MEQTTKDKGLFDGITIVRIPEDVNPIRLAPANIPPLNTKAEKCNNRKVMSEQGKTNQTGLLESFHQNLLHRAMNRGENEYKSANVSVDDFKKFCGVFIPFYLDKCKSDEQFRVVSKLSEFRNALKEQYPNEANMLTEPFLEFVHPYLKELNIYVLYDHAHSSRTDKIAFTRTSYLIEEEQTIRLKHYLLDEEMYVAKDAK